MGVNSNKKKSFSRTAKEYASHSSIHGIGYVFNKELGHCDRLLWLLVTLAFLGLAILLTWNTWTQWREEQVLSNHKVDLRSVGVFCFLFLTLCPHNWLTG